MNRDKLMKNSRNYTEILVKKIHEKSHINKYKKKKPKNLSYIVFFIIIIFHLLFLFLYSKNNPAFSTAK